MIQSLARKISQRARAKRGETFRALLDPQPTDKILDLGGGNGAHFAAISPFRDNVTVADFSERNLAKAAEYGFQTKRVDGSDRLPFKDGEFDIVFCSSVIEHVTGPREQMIGMTDDAEFRRLAEYHQTQFAKEIRRISKGYFVQTPNRTYPVESHSLLPGFIAVAPRKIQVPVLDFFATSFVSKVWPAKSESEWRLLNGEEFAAMFPDGQLVRERTAGLTKSLMAVRRPLRMQPPVEIPGRQARFRPAANARTPTSS